MSETLYRLHGMGLIRVQVFSKLPTDLPRDGVSNTLYFGKAGFLPTDYEAIATDVKNVYQTAGYWSGWQYDVRAYDNDDPPKTPPKSRITGSFTGSAIAKGPREVALCLSYRTDAPYTSRRRGRIYIGPFNGTLTNADRPNTTVMNGVLAMGQALAGIGGEDISWRVYSPTNNEDHHIRYCWVDNAWDTVRGRGQDPNARVGADV